MRGLRGADHRVPVRFRLRDDGVALDLGDARFAQRVQVALPVLNVANGETDDAQPHVGHVAGGDFLDFGGKLIAVLVNVLHGHRAENGAQVAFQGLGCDTLDFVNRLAQHLLGRRGNRDVVAFDFYLGHAVHLHRDAFAGIDFRRLHINGQQFQRKPVHFFKDGDDECAAAFDDAKSARPNRAIRLDISVLASGNDEDLVRPHFGVAAGPNGGEEEYDDDDSHCGDNNNAGIGDV